MNHFQVIELKAELRARGQPVTGVKIDLKKRLTKILQQENEYWKEICTAIDQYVL